MKKVLFIAALFLSLTNIGMAQENLTENDNRGKLQLGLKVGLNFSNVYDSQGDQFKADAKAGFAGGAFLVIPIGAYLGIQPEFLISQKGFKATGVSLGNDYKFTRTTTYIDVPLLVTLKPIEFLTLNAGPQFSFLMKQTDAFTVSESSYEQQQVFKNDNIRKSILGIVVGANVNIQHFTLGARYCWDVQNNNGDGTSTTPRYKNAWFQATVGYKFFLPSSIKSREEKQDK